MRLSAVPSAVNAASSCDCEHVGSGAKAISEKQDEGFTWRKYRERAEVVDADGDAGPFWQGQHDGGPPARLPPRFPFLALQTVV